MTRSTGNRPAEVFGYPLMNRSSEAERIRRRHQCPFQDRTCDKKSRLIDFPFGVCSVEHRGKIKAICPRRFEERGETQGISLVLENIAFHYFGAIDNTVVFPKVSLTNVGVIDYVIVKHKPMLPEIDDFVSVEFQSDSTTSTGALVQGLQDFVDGRDVMQESYRFGINTYDSIKRAITQLMNKGIVYESWNTKCYWVIQEYIYRNIVSRYGLKAGGFTAEDASRFALYDLLPKSDRLTLTPTRYVSTTVDDVYRAMRNNPSLPNKDRFVASLKDKLQLRLLTP